MTRATVTAAALASAASWLTRVIPTKPTVPILGGVVLDVTSDVDRDEVTASAFDYDTYGAARLGDGVISVDTPGRLVVSGRLLASLAKTLGSSDAPVVLETDDAGRLGVTIGRSRWSMPEMRIEDYPQAPVNGQQVGTVGSRALVAAIERVSDAVDKAGTVQALTGVAVMGDGDQLRLVATDRYRMAIAETVWKAEGELPQVLVPPALLRFAATAMHDEDGPVGLHFDGATLGFSLPSRTIVGRLVGAEFVRWRQLDVTPESAGSSFGASCVLAVADLRAATSRAAVMLEDRATLRLHFSDAGVEVSAAGDRGNTEHVADVSSYSGDEVWVNVNPDFLRDCLDGMGTDLVRLDLNTRYRPFLARPVGEDGEVADGYRHTVMPVKDLESVGRAA